MATITMIFAWIATHPAEFGLITSFVGWLFTSIVGAFKPKTPEEYAAMSPRKAAFLKLAATVATDFPKAIESFGQFVKGTQDPKKVSK